MSRTYKDDFDLKETCWLDVANQGPIPRVARKEIQRMAAWKADPASLTIERFAQVPDDLKAALAQFVGGQPAEIVLGNSASYFVDLLARGLPWKTGDEILVWQGDFPTNIVSFVPLATKGIRLVRCKSRSTVLTIDDLKRHVSVRTRLLCVSWVHSFNGHALDVEAIGSFCRQHGILCCLNGSQAVGYMPIDVSHLHIDMLFSCGFKWMLGPYGTGFAWMRPPFMSALRTKTYWGQYFDGDLDRMQEIGDRHDIENRFHDTYGTANFLNYGAWNAAIRYLIDVGSAVLQEHIFEWLDRCTRHLPSAKYDIISAMDSDRRSGMLVLRPKNDSARIITDRLQEAGIHVGLREGNLRITPHIYNDDADLQRLLTRL